MRLSKSSGALAASLVAVALASTACSSSKGSGTPASSAKPVVSTQEQINAQPRSALQQGGTLKLPMTQWSSNWQLGSTNGNVDQDTQTVMSALLPSPFHFKADATPYYDPDYLTGEPTESTVGGKQTITYELNPKAVWSDGTPITYKDWAANWKALNGAVAAFAPASTTGYNQISSVVEGKNQYEVVVTFSTPFADWKSLFGPLYPASEVDNPNDFNKKLMNTLGLSGGPFMLGSMSQTDKTVTLVPNPKWWGDAPLLSSIAYSTIDVNATAQAFANGEIDSFDIGPDPVGLKTAKSAKNSVILTAGGPQYRQLTMNGSSPILSDQSVRQAIAEALNRQAIAQSDLAGMGVPETLVNSHFFMPNQVGYTNNAGAVGTYNPSAAEQLLTQAGWTQSAGSAYRTKNGKELDLNLLIPQNVSVASNEATLITSMLKQIGIKVTTTQEGDNFFTDINGGKFDLTVFSWILSDFPVSGNVSLYQSSAAQGGNWGQNFTHLGSAQLDSLLLKASDSTNQADETTIINQADQQIWQEAGLIPFYERPEIEGQVKNLANFGAFGFADIIWQNVGFTK
jgi:peptide/nickel transport system substrate-binding protein